MWTRQILIVLCVCLYGTLSLNTTLSVDRYILNEAENDRLKQACGTPKTPIGRFKSLYGTVEKDGEAPWVASITHMEDSYFPEMSATMREQAEVMLCTGSLISPRHVLTAAHCFGPLKKKCDDDHSFSLKRKNLDRFRVYLGGSCSNPKMCRKLQRDDELVGRKISRLFLPSYFAVNTCESGDSGDIALLELAEPIEYTSKIYPVCLPTQNMSSISANTPIIGYGFGDDNAQSGDHMTDFGVLKSVSEMLAECSEMGFTGNDTFCTDAEFQQTCSGDSGGGMIIRKSRRKELIAIVKGGVHCSDMVKRNRKLSVRSKNDGRETTISIKTSVFPHLNWICAVSGVCSPLAKRMMHPGIVSEQGPLPYSESFAD